MRPILCIFSDRAVLRDRPAAYGARVRRTHRDQPYARPCRRIEARGKPVLRQERLNMALHSREDANSWDAQGWREVAAAADPAIRIPAGKRVVNRIVRPGGKEAD